MPELSASDFEDFIRCQFSIAGLPVTRCSQILFSHLARMPNYGGLNMPFQFVQQEIAHLEDKRRRTATKTETPYGHQLRGFMHKHFYVPGYKHPYFVLRNAWKLKPDGSSNKLSGMISPLYKRYVRSRQTVEDVRRFAEQVASNVVTELSNRLHSSQATGDAIVYARHEGQNYYLCVAPHSDYDFILDTLRRCAQQFPFVSALLCSNTDPEGEATPEAIQAEEDLP